MSRLPYAACFVGCWLLSGLYLVSPLEASRSSAEVIAAPAPSHVDSTVTSDTATSNTDLNGPLSQATKKKNQEGEQKKEKGEKRNKAAAKKKAARNAEKPTETEKNEDSEEDQKKSPEKDQETPEKDDDEKDKKDGEESSDDKQDKAKTVDLTGIFAATRVEEIVLRPEEWKDLKVLSAVAHGSAVSKGETLIHLDSEGLEKSIQDLKHQLALDELSFEQASEELRLMRRSTPLALEQAERRKEQAEEDLRLFEEKDREQTEESANFMVEMSENRLAYQQEELNQLEKMYEADDLTEETEEIILRRTRDAVKTAEYSLRQSKRQRDRTLSVNLPRSELSHRTSAVQSQLNWDQAQVGLPSLLKQAEINLEKQELALEKSRKKLESLETDRELVKVTAPSSGYVYYGAAERGKWKNASTVASTLKRGGTLKADQVLMTIVRARPVEIHANIAEKELAKLKLGDVGTVVPTAFPSNELTAEIAEIQLVPVSEGQFGAILELDSLPHRVRVMPGMTCKISFEVDEDEEEEK